MWRLALAVTLAMLAIGAGSAQAATVNATCLDLQSKITAANDGDVIVLAAGSVCTGDSFILPGDKPPPYSITIQGAGAGATLDGTGASSRIMDGTPSSGHQLNVTIRNLTFRNGATSSGGSGGALRLQGGDASAALDG